MINNCSPHEESEGRRENLGARQGSGSTALQASLTGQSVASKYIPGRSHFPHLLHTRSIVIFCRVSHCHCRCQWLFSFDLSSQNTSQTQTTLYFHPIIRLYYGVYTLLKHNKQLTKRAGEFILHEFVIAVLSISCYRSSVQICSLISRYRWYTTNVR